eukprot:CAMPEP_0117495894 /NCGR_PEP_ID=MMETSP0784-20121206/20371_1 /TAXON_ID=39447 /ORGANISM="" /LENGTH=769 /DNA_ID=CAMNT_0005290837 /DNA_START=76 /DNA_END=2385 /DNA_ORIENTATION=-
MSDADPRHGLDGKGAIARANGLQGEMSWRAPASVDAVELPVIEDVEQRIPRGSMVAVSSTSGAVRPSTEAITGSGNLGVHAEAELMQQALRQNREIQSRLQKAIAASKVEQAAGEAQEGALEQFISYMAGTARGKHKQRTVVPLSFFSMPSDPKTVPPKNIDGVRRNLFREVQLGGLLSTYRYRTWSKAEIAALEEVLGKILREAVFTRLYTERKRRTGPDASVIEVHQLFASLKDELKDMSTAQLLHEQGFKADWTRISKELAKRGFQRDGRSCYIKYFQDLDPALNKGPFAKDEDKALLQLSSEYGGFDWDTVAKRMGTGRGAWDCLCRYQQCLNPHVVRTTWTSDDARAVERLMGQTCAPRLWSQLAARIGGGRLGSQLQNRWLYVDAASQRKRCWTPTESRRLKLAVQIYGRGRWAEVAVHVPRRPPGACLQRFEFVDLEGLRRAPRCLEAAASTATTRHGPRWDAPLPWTEEEDQALLEGIDRYGAGNWTLIRRDVPGRTTAECFHRFQRLNPECDGVGMADTYDRLLATKQKMLPSIVPMSIRRSRLVASDFLLRLDEVPRDVQSTGHRAPVACSEVTTHNPLVDRHLRRLNARRLMKVKRGQALEFHAGAPAAEAPRKSRCPQEASRRGRGRGGRGRLRGVLQPKANAGPELGVADDVAEQTQPTKRRGRVVKVDGEPRCAVDEVDRCDAEGNAAAPPTEPLPGAKRQRADDGFVRKGSARFGGGDDACCLGAAAQNCVTPARSSSCSPTENLGSAECAPAV